MICKVCNKKLNKPEKAADTTGNVEAGSRLYKTLPADSLIHGLFPGHVPIEPRDLNTVEVLMISIYSSISKVTCFAYHIIASK